MTMSLAAFQSALGCALQGGDACPVDPDSPGIRFTAKVRRSWCEGRAINAARVVLTLVPHEERRRLVSAYVDGRGLASFLPQVDHFLHQRFLRRGCRSIAHQRVRMEQALADQEGARSSALTGMGIEDSAEGRHAAMVRFMPTKVLMALNGGPPSIGAAGHAVLFAPGLPDLFRAAGADEASLWDSMPTNGPPRVVDRLVTEGVLEYQD
jgi:hypothetical protein